MTFSFYFASLISCIRFYRIAYYIYYMKYIYNLCLQILSAVFLHFCDFLCVFQALIALIISSICMLYSSLNSIACDRRKIPSELKLHFFSIKYVHKRKICGFVKLFGLMLSCSISVGVFRRWKNSLISSL